jgi:amino acid efflux transporter
VSGLLLITLYGFGLVSTTSLVDIPTTLFLAVYLGSMLAAVRVLRGPARMAAVPASAAVAIMLACCGWALALPVLVAVAVIGRHGGGRRRLGQAREGAELPSRHHEVAHAQQWRHRLPTRGGELQQ